jgi:hypothetical protein
MNVSQGVRSDRLVHSGAAGDSVHDAAGAVPIHPLAVGSQEDRAVESFTDNEIDCSGGAWCERDGHNLAALAQDAEGAVPALEAEGVDVGGQELRRSAVR